jgi:N-succinyldiaminopimelate aminotransferase
VNLDPPDWRYREEDLKRALTSRTRVLMLNDPLNPAGTVASEAELAMIAEICVRHDLTAICDEVWEDVRFDGVRHRSLIGFPGMESRAVKIGSAGKIFGLTGWKIGWMCAHGGMAAGLARAHQFLTFTSPPALQWAVAEGLAKSDDWFAAQRQAWAASRARLRQGLERAGYAVLPNDATWFLCVDLTASGVTLEDREFSERAVHEVGVASIPVSALFEGKGPRNVVRFCFTKPDEVLDEAVRRLNAFRGKLRSGALSV